MIKDKIRIIKKYKEMQRTALNLKELDVKYTTPYRVYPELIGDMGEGYEYNTSYTVNDGIVTGVSYKFDSNVSTFPTGASDVYTSIEYDNYNYTGSDTAYLNNQGVDFLQVNNESLAIRTTAGATFQNVLYFNAPNLVSMTYGGTSSSVLPNVTQIDAPLLETIGRGNYFANYGSSELSLPSLLTCDGTIANSSTSIRKFYANNVQSIGDIANNANSVLEHVECKNLSVIPNRWLSSCKNLKDVWIGVLTTSSATYPPFANVDKSIFTLHVKSGSNQEIVNRLINNGFNVEVY